MIITVILARKDQPMILVFAKLPLLLPSVLRLLILPGLPVNLTARKPEQSPANLHQAVAVVLLFCPNHAHILRRPAQASLILTGQLVAQMEFRQEQSPANPHQAVMVDRPSFPSHVFIHKYVRVLIIQLGQLAVQAVNKQEQSSVELQLVVLEALLLL
jgi:hypothetical protein